MAEPGVDPVSLIAKFEAPCSVQLVYEAHTICVVATHVWVDKSLEDILDLRSPDIEPATEKMVVR